MGWRKREHRNIIRSGSITSVLVKIIERNEGDMEAKLRLSDLMNIMFESDDLTWEDKANLERLASDARTIKQLKGGNNGEKKASE